jgi:hypothetical protein
MSASKEILKGKNERTCQKDTQGEWEWGNLSIKANTDVDRL